ncbi:secreted protein [Beggiatoa sp. SS]|nr:secreted protein [Beggiatoa sp. SS]
MKNLISSTIFIIIAGILIAYSSSVRSSSDNLKLETIARTHFIVLIRDTGRMNKKFYPLQMIVPTLPKLLFQGEAALKSKTALNPALPVYDPKRDHLSVVFVAIHKDDTPKTRCKNAPALSTLPQHIFHWQPVKQGQNQAAFTQSLKQWLNQKCRAQGHVSSSVLAERMILPYVQGKLVEEGYQELQFSRTILILLGNDAYYGGSLPSRELFALKRGLTRENKKGKIEKVREELRDIETAASLIEGVDRAFHIVTPPDWVFTIHTKSQQFDRSDTLPMVIH